MPKKKQEMYRKFLVDFGILIVASVMQEVHYDAMGQDSGGEAIHREFAG